ncbi:helix-turn-helix transcriptional regulator [Bradyrhizobium sp. HKCCYLS2038]|uniref:helix-turn-helix transcriptional regulator n=1 Tax=Bradyrhizobium sp. HKCCYLS2038 TaxID=3420764 RepID=UPI003EB71C20
MDTPEPRLMSGRQAAAYCGVTLATWSKWVADGAMPKPVIGRRWDRKAIDLALDKASGIQVQQVAEDECPLEKWMGEDAKRTALAEREWEQRYDARKGRRPR